ncbi:hypothetical protein LSH36_633g00004 [Paralvinella palmiformis]|uniref:Uncharacterized protein n=1 Tax=Paralvinella palmiformis TaxID=53620 RepID=A0AAD9J3N1_9ANNE|nr:hypothetical protein LSH36_633g00004 [Paralvinella palmiformis]
MALFFCLCIFFASLKCTGVQTRTMIITFIPLAFLAALMNFIGLLTFAVNLYTIQCRPSYSIALDTFAVIGFSAGGICALLEIQGCFRENIEETDSIPPPLLHRPHTAGLAFVTS